MSERIQKWFIYLSMILITVIMAMTVVNQSLQLRHNIRQSEMMDRTDALVQEAEQIAKDRKEE